MNSSDPQLERLLRAAGRAPSALPQEAPFSIHTRVLAHWRALPGAAGEYFAHTLLPLLRQAALCACLLMLLSIAFSYRAIITGEDEAVRLANSAVDLTLLP